MACAHGEAFSLVEMLIAIVILGLGLVMIATIFPIAWGRARELNEHTVERSVTLGAEATLQSLLQPAGLSSAPSLDSGASGLRLRLNYGSLAGDIFYDPTLAERAPFNDLHAAVLAYSDTRVHALNIENLLATGDVSAVPVPEAPWRLERVTDFVGDTSFPNMEYPRDLGVDFPLRSFLSAQVRFVDRVHPPLPPPPTSPPLTTAELAELRERWTEQLAKRRFAWAVLHRLREPVGPRIPTIPLTAGDSATITAQAADAIGTTRTFDMYYVTLRRPKPTHRYARQQTDEPNAPPDPFNLTTMPAVPAAFPAEQDMTLPVPWRVQVQFPPTLSSRTATAPGFEPTGIPTEIEVPPGDFPGSDETGVMLVQMFPAGTQFVDEITGAVYRVARRRIAGDKGERASLTLDREVVMEDIDLPTFAPQCEACLPIDPANPVADKEELLRTVWVFPPPVDRSFSGTIPVLSGSTPVVDIDVRTLSLTPSF